MGVAKYDGLRDNLLAQGDVPVEMTFSDIEALVGPLPASATTYAVWWNDGPGERHVQARAWMDAGRKVEWVDRDTRRVRFSRPSWHRR
jgi:hypothetical protein